MKNNIAVFILSCLASIFMYRASHNVDFSIAVFFSLNAMGMYWE